MKKPTDRQLDRLAKRIYDDCRPQVNRAFPERFDIEWKRLQPVTRFGWRVVAKWHLEHKDT